jgi:hypothetical protein
MAPPRLMVTSGRRKWNKEGSRFSHLRDADMSHSSPAIRLLPSVSRHILPSHSAVKLGDLAILCADFSTVPEDEIMKIKSHMTIIDGKIVYEPKPGS